MDLAPIAENMEANPEITSFPLQRLSPHLIDQVLEKMNRQDFNRLRRTSSGMNQYLTKTRQRFYLTNNLEHSRCPSAVIRIKSRSRGNRLEITITHYCWFNEPFDEDEENMHIQLHSRLRFGWNERWEILGTQSARICLKNISADQWYCSVLPYLKRLCLSSLPSFEGVNLTGGVLVSALENYVSCETIKTHTSHFADAYAHPLIELWQKFKFSAKSDFSGEMKKAVIHFTTMIDPDTIVRTLLNNVWSRKVWDRNMHFESLLREMPIDWVLRDVLVVYLIPRDGTAHPRSRSHQKEAAILVIQNNEVYFENCGTERDTFVRNFRVNVLVDAVLSNRLIHQDMIPWP